MEWYDPGPVIDARLLEPYLCLAQGMPLNFCANYC